MSVPGETEDLCREVAAQHSNLKNHLKNTKHAKILKLFRYKKTSGHDKTF